jgi:thioredoxin 1
MSGMKKIIKLSATWCGPCKAYSPIFNETSLLLKEAGISIEALDVDTDEGKAVAESFGVRGVPATVFIWENDESKVEIGALSKDKILEIAGV